MEDLNYLLKREQEELLHAQNATCAAERRAHHVVATRYARRVRNHPHPYRSEQANGMTPFDPYPYGGGERDSV
jgi:hypothetical protein